MNASGHLVERTACPVCGEERCTVEIELPYDTGPIRVHLATFYNGHFDLSLVAGERFVVQRCTRCGLLFQRFVPSPHLLSLLYSSVATADAAVVSKARGLSIRQTYSHQVEQFINYWRHDPTALRVLDFGSGTGLWLRMVEAYGCDTHAAELSPTHAAHLGGRGITVHAADALPNESFHFINAEQVFEHLVLPALVIRQLARALLPGGLLRIAVPNSTNVAGLLGNPDWEAPKGSRFSLNAIAPLEHINAFTRAPLKVLGEEAGLQLFEYPLRQYLHAMERARFIGSAFLHVLHRRQGTQILFRRRL